MIPASAIAQQIHEFVVENFLFGQERPLSEDDSFAEEGIVDSTGVLQLVTFLEDTYGITVEDEELAPENLDSIRSVTTFLWRKMNPSAEAGPVRQTVPGD